MWTSPLSCRPRNLVGGRDGAKVFEEQADCVRGLLWDDAVAEGAELCGAWDVDAGDPLVGQSHEMFDEWWRGGRLGRTVRSGSGRVRIGR